MRFPRTHTHASSVIPLNGVFGKGPHPHRFVHANVTGITPHSITLSRALPDEHAGHVNCVEDNVDGPSCIPFDFAIYALGSKLPAPINLWTRPSEAGLNGDDTNDENLLAPQVQKGTKKEGVSWMQSSQERIARAESVLVVGGGALGIRVFITLALPNLALIHPFRVRLRHQVSSRSHPSYSPPFSKTTASSI
jgi:hypothetical protein